MQLQPHTTKQWQSSLYSICYVSLKMISCKWCQPTDYTTLRNDGQNRRTHTRQGRTQIHDSNGDPVTHNPLSVERTYGNRDNTLTNLANRGIHFAICNLSTLGMAGMIARAAGRQSDEVYQELVANAVPNSHFVAAGVLGATRAQEYGYTFMYASDAD